ncbi:MAG TPA: thioredoxin domain-containing protein [Candidatus Sulfotelmatobacter sp.]|nr:thioredoxin domain-containing protein [Candidatus Sulfotelmatobacter sp.]
MSKQFLIVLAVIVVVFIGVFALGSHKPNNTNSNTPSHNVIGEGQDGVTLVEYGDFQCPYCGEYYATVKQVQQQYNTQMVFQFVNFPLTSIHQNAFAGARAAEAAAQQGQFWPMHDLLYQQNQVYYDSNETASTWINSTNPITYFDQYAKQLGLNLTEFNSAYSSNAVDNTINSDMNKGNKLGVNATPTFYLDGKQIMPTNSVSSFETYINAAIASKTHSS